MRIVADTNILVSAFLWGGPPRALLEAARVGMIKLYTSAALIAELEEILARPKFLERLRRVGSSIEEIVGDYLALVELVRPIAVPRVVITDPDDDEVIAAALTIKADLIVTGDIDLLALGGYQGIPIISAAECLRRLRQQ